MIADSSPVYKKMFLKAIEDVDDNASVICVSDGKDAADVIVQKNPDVVVVDAEIKNPGLLELITLILRDTPKTFILVTSRPSSTSAKIFMEALTLGASYAMTKPIYDSYNDNFETVKTRMAELFGALDVKNKKSYTAAADAKPKKSTSIKNFRPQLILFAVSTGGPRALEAIISELNPDIPVPILIVQHMPPHFIETLAGRLDTRTKLKVKVAENGEKLIGKTIYLAPGGVHMRLNSDNEVYLDDSPPQNGVRPAADALFESVADDFAGMRVLAVVLTGMGQDSLKGLIKLKDKKRCFGIAQSEKTCVVYGMPRAVVEEGLIDKVLDLDNIAAEINGFNYI